MRRAVLLRSVQRRLRADEDLVDAAFMWCRHRLVFPYAATAFVALVGMAVVVGFDTWPARLGVGIAGASVAAMATTEYRVLARTSQGFVLLRASRVRQYAVEVLERWEPPVELERLGGYGVVADWQVYGRRFTVPKSSEGSMARMATSP